MKTNSFNNLVLTSKIRRYFGYSIKQLLEVFTLLGKTDFLD
jgi:hypothetical protein